MPIAVELSVGLAVSLAMIGLYFVVRWRIPTHRGVPTAEPRTDLEQATMSLMEHTYRDRAEEWTFAALTLLGALATLCVSLVFPSLLLTIVGLGLGVLVPLGALLLQQSQRQRKVSEQLPPAMFELAKQVQQGTNWHDAIRRVGQTSPEPVCHEFHRATVEVSLGLPPEVALSYLTHPADRHTS